MLGAKAETQLAIDVIETRASATPSNRLCPWPNTIVRAMHQAAPPFFTNTTSSERFSSLGPPSLLLHSLLYKHLPAVPPIGRSCNTDLKRFAAVSLAGAGAHLQSPELVPISYLVISSMMSVMLDAAGGNIPQDQGNEPSVNAILQFMAFYGRKRERDGEHHMSQGSPARLTLPHS